MHRPHRGDTPRHAPQGIARKRRVQDADEQKEPARPHLPHDPAGDDRAEDRAKAVQKDQPRRRGGAEHPRRRLGVGDGPREQQPRAGEGAGDGAGRPRRRLHALPLRRMVARQGPEGQLPGWRGPDHPGRGDQHQHDVRV